MIRAFILEPPPGSFADGVPRWSVQRTADATGWYVCRPCVVRVVEAPAHRWAHDYSSGWRVIGGLTAPERCA